MNDFSDAADKLEVELSKFASCTRSIDKVNVKKYNVNIDGEDVTVFLLKASMTGSERPKPQVRVFTDNIIQEVMENINSDIRQFFFVYSALSKIEAKLTNIDPCDYIVSLENDWATAAGRIDIRSIYDFIESNPSYNFKKITKKQHSATSILQATFFKDTVNGFERIEGYLRHFDNRLIINTSTLSVDVDVDVDASNIIGVNKIYFGAPGTGKSYSVQKFIRSNGLPDYEDALGHPNVYRTTLHPEFTYYDFVGQVMPKITKSNTTSSDNKIEYDFVPNIFTKALRSAVSAGDNEVKEPVFLILEEMSRANVAAIFGDIFQLLDRNVETGVSEYRINNDFIADTVYGDNRPIYIPSNLFIIGTVNTNDQNVFVMDTAFKRRFLFDYISANEIAYDNQDNPLNSFTFSLENESGKRDVFDWITMYRALNKIITKKVANGGLGLKEDMQLGQFFIKFKDNDSDFNFNQIQGKLLQYLYSDIEDISYTEVSLFKPHINSFGDAYMQLGLSKNIFSEVFMAEYDSVAKEDASQGLVDD